MQAVILAGGLATRLGELAKSTPKSLVPVAGRPFLEHQLALLERSGFTHVLVCIGHLGDKIRDFAGDGRRFGLHLDYSEDGPVPLGTAGALRSALGSLAPHFLVTYGDSYLPFDYSAPLRDLLAHPEASGTMAVNENRGRFDASNTEVRGKLVVRYEKGASDAGLDHIDYGATALRREVIADLAPGIAIGFDRVQSELARAGKLRSLVATERFYEIGSLAGVAELEAFLHGSGQGV
jgi:MurNAc alpha-1-phosphate uridylyltransferase